MVFNTTIGNNVAEAAGFLQQGLVVGIPTETVYGLAANALNPDAVLKIFTVKNRPHFDPLIVHTKSVQAIADYVEEIPPVAAALMDAFMPGPLTLLLRKKAIVPDLVTSGLDTVAIRVPKHPLTQQLLAALPFPLAAPSANPFGYISPTSAYHVYDQLHGRIPYILDGGTTEIGVESTIVGFEGGQPVVYRLGGLTLEELEQVAGRIEMNISAGSNPQSPGMLSSHYAPRKKLYLLNENTIAEPEKAGVIAFNKPVEGVPLTQQILLSEKGDVKEAAHNLFAAMRRLDVMPVDVLYAVQFPEVGLGRAINDRLKRASA